jgi:hypothetical protein
MNSTNFTPVAASAIKVFTVCGRARLHEECARDFFFSTFFDAAVVLVRIVRIAVCAKQTDGATNHF